ncbi:unnamed protein product [Rotaria magnacalcarata]|uniref:Uncharacterized protein n=1 Tax=Rotaria magnacalcarata TaxID=392030 RepID=A0A8S2P6K8_9BILA|nr:unnamed protein product [Rotaria magnacalcarata]
MHTTVGTRRLNEIWQSGQLEEGVVDGIGGSVTRMVYQDVMAGKHCHNASDFVALIRDKKTSIIVDELLISDIEAAHAYLTSLFQDVKTVPSIQKVHSMTVVDVDEISCRKITSILIGIIIIEKKRIWRNRWTPSQGNNNAIEKKVIIDLSKLNCL